MWKNKKSYVDLGGVFGLSIIKHVTLQKIVAHDFRYDLRILLLSHSLIFFRFLFYKSMVIIYVFLLEEAMYSYCCLCSLIVSLCILIVVYVFVSLSMCCLCVLRHLDTAALTEVFPCFFLSCKANARV